MFLKSVCVCPSLCCPCPTRRYARCSCKDDLGDTHVGVSFQVAVGMRGGLRGHDLFSSVDTWVLAAKKALRTTSWRFISVKL